MPNPSTVARGWCCDECGAAGFETRMVSIAGTTARPLCDGCTVEALRRAAAEQLRAGIALQVRDWGREHAPSTPGEPLDATLADVLELADAIERGPEPFLTIIHTE